MKEISGYSRFILPNAFPKLLEGKFLLASMMLVGSLLLGFVCQASAVIAGYSNDIYRPKAHPSPPTGISLVVQVLDGLTNQPIPDVLVLMDRLATSERLKNTTDSLGNVYLTVAEETSYNVSGELKGQRWQHPPIRTQSLKREQENVVKIYLFNEVTDFDAMDVVVFDRHNDEGDVLVSLNQRLYQWQEEAGQCFLKGEGRKILLSRTDKSGTVPIGLMEKVEQVFEQGGLAVRSITVIENVFFDFDRDTICLNAQVMLETLASVMQHHTSLRVSLSGHTDSRGTDAYNEALSQRRSAAVVSYLIDQGIAPERIQASYWGERRLSNGCSDEVLCPEEQHQRSRRVEFGIKDLSAKPELIAAD